MLRLISPIVLSTEEVGRPVRHSGVLSALGLDDKLGRLQSQFLIWSLMMVSVTNHDCGQLRPDEPRIIETALEEITCI